jgi:UDP-N-acetylglucosamine--N-acetylmuramyl-(pentapeptide) pyrophosphoryl-undecaprenol N-acetylglucosamine transferase
MEHTLVKRESVPFAAIQAGALNGVGLGAAVRGAWRTVRGTVSALGVIRRFKPGCVLLTGGFVGVPVAFAAKALRVPSVVYLPDIEPGLALNIMARFATKVTTTTEASAAFIAAHKMVVTGYPVRDVFATLTRESAREQLGLPRDSRVVLVFGGSKGARSINQSIAAGIGELLALGDDVHVIQVTGAQGHEDIAARHAAEPEALRARWHVHQYLHEEMAAAMFAADLAVCRSGASSLGELPYAGLPAVLVPYPYAWRYQKVNAQYLTDKGAAVLLADAALEKELITTIRTLLADAAALAKMRQNAQALARRDGAQRIAAVLKEVHHD